MDDVQLIIQSIVAQAKQLGLTWSFRPGVILKYNSVSTATILLDGDEFNIIAINMVGQTNLFSRVMCIIVPNQAVYIVGKIGKYIETGELVCRIRQGTTTQTLTTAVNTFVNFDTVDYDPFGFFRTATPDRVTPKFAGWFRVNCRGVFAANATSRRGAFVNMNGTTSGTGSIGGQSLQAPATGTAQVEADGAGLFNGVSDYVGLRLLQNSGVNVDTSVSDGGCLLEVFYAGPGRV